MALPRFIDRALDALTRLPVDRDRDWFLTRLSSSSITLEAAGGVNDHPAHRSGYLLAANLAARQYPAIQLAGPTELCDDAAKLIRAINPVADVDRGRTATKVSLGYGVSSKDDHNIGVMARGWLVDLHPAHAQLLPVIGPAALAASTVGMAELFRQLIGDVLPQQKRRASPPLAFNLIDWGSDPLSDSLSRAPLDIGRVHLAGAGAVGEAAALTLGTMALSGELWPVDHESVALSNLQRYVLAYDADVDRPKAQLVAERLAGSTLRVTEVPTKWGADGRSGPGSGTVLAALDTGAGRIEVAGSLAPCLYNAFTGPSDLGWSRHEAFGEAPCLACLYWPSRPVPSRHEVIGEALDVNPERVLLYLIRPTLPVGSPAVQSGSGTFKTDERERRAWYEQSLLDDLVARSVMTAVDAEQWRDQPIEALYRDGVCGGGFVPGRSTRIDRDVIVPLAHQSVFAGIMLATQLVTALDPQLRSLRPPAIEGRLDLLAPLPQIVTRPRIRTQGCICFDADFGGHS